MPSLRGIFSIASLDFDHMAPFQKTLTLAVQIREFQAQSLRAERNVVSGHQSEEGKH